nr:prephenate dehydrogenase [Oscillospiraceae bacterium]
MKFDKYTKILIIGLGVIGGSYAKALTEKGYNVSCITKETADVRFGLENNMISYGTTEVEPQLVADAEIVVFALYPKDFIGWIKKYQHLFSPGTLITDVTGVKSSVVYEVQDILRPDVEYIAAHPMAGRERSGVEFADPSVFRGANYIVTPTDKNSLEAIKLCKALGEELGFLRISELTPEEHDEMIAFLSQLTHVIAVTLMNCNDSDGLEKYTGDSFRDLTRIAKINDRMWSELFLMNKDALLCEMDRFIEEFTEFRGYLANEDGKRMREKMRASTARRSLFDKPAK